jgi:hypothetical protein
MAGRREAKVVGRVDRDDTAPASTAAGGTFGAWCARPRDAASDADRAWGCVIGDAGEVPRHGIRRGTNHGGADVTDVPACRTGDPCSVPHLDPPYGQFPASR